jgi:PAS domain S-box-containing protein
MADQEKIDLESAGILRDYLRRISQGGTYLFKSLRIRVAVTAVAFIAYAIVYILTEQYLRPVTGILAAAPVAIAGWFLGTWAGLLCALLSLPLNAILLMVLDRPVNELFQIREIVVIASLLLMGFAVGRLHELVDHLRLDLKSRLRGEFAFWGSRERYQALDTASTGIAVTDNIERLLYCNLTLADMLGYVPDEFEEKFLDQFLEPSEISKLRENIDLMKKGIPTKYEVAMRRKDGHHRTMLFSSVPRFAADGSYDGALSIIIDITDRKQAEDALRESEEKFRTLAEQSPNMIFINKMGKVIYANPLCEKIMGYSREEFYSPDFDFMKLIVPESRELTQMNFKQHLEGKDVFPDEYALITKEGERIEAIVATKLIHYEEERAILGIITDVTDRVRADEALRVSEERYRSIFEQAADSIFLIDAESGELVEYNDQTFENLGYTREEFKALKITDFEVIETPEEIENHVEYILQEEHDRFMTKHRTKDGKIRNIQVSSRSISIHGKDYIQTIARDITELVEAEEKLRESEEKHRQLVENANDIIYGTDIDGHFTFINPVAVKVLGYSENELIGKTFIDLIHPDWQQDIDRFYRSQFSERILNTYNEFPTIAKDGAEIWFGQNVQLVMEGKIILGFQAVARDITKRKLAEQEVRKNEAKLQSIIRVAPVGIFLVLDRVIQHVNDYMCEMMGYSPEELIGKDTRLLYPSDEEYEYVGAEKYDQTREQDKGTVGTRLKRKNGETIDVLLNSVFIDLADPSAGVMFTALDITERKRSVTALRESEEKFRTLANTAKDAILMIDNEGKISFWNKSSEEIFGYQSDEVMGVELHEVILRKSCQQDYFNGLAIFQQSGEVPEAHRLLEFEAVKKDGTEFPIEISISTFQINGEWNAVGIIREITK